MHYSPPALNSLCEKNSKDFVWGFFVGFFCLWGENTGFFTRREFCFLRCFTERPIILTWGGKISHGSGHEFLRVFRWEGITLANLFEQH